MELPHLTLFLRRYRRRWWRGWLAALLIWGSLALLRHELGALVPWLNSQSLSEELIILCGNFVVYLILAQSMAPLAQEPHSFGLSTLRRGEGVDRPPLWITTPLAGWRALGGCLLSGLLSCLPWVLGLVLYIMAAVDAERQLGQPAFWASLWISNLRLPHLALASACLLLALRHSVLSPYLPTLLALTATLSSQWSTPYQYIYTGIFNPGSSEWNLWRLPQGGQTLLQGLLLLILLLAALWWACGRSEGPGRQRDYSSNVLQLTMFLLFVGLPLLVGATSFSARYGSLGYDLLEPLENGLLTPLHSALLHVYPDIYAIQVNPYGDLRPGGVLGASYMLYGSRIAIGAARDLLLQLLLLSLCLWQLAAVFCIEAARRPIAAQKRPRPLRYPEDFLDL